MTNIRLKYLKRQRIRFIVVAGLGILATVVSLLYTQSKGEIQLEQLSRIELEKQRGEYFFNLLRDPATNEIPANIRLKELKFDKELSTRKAGMRTTSDIDYAWCESGISTIGGRTRALAYDQNDPSIILAGGVSGGMFKSTDAGESWVQTSDPTYSQSITAIAQDTTGGNEIWYYAGGEIEGNSTTDRGFTATYYGAGLFRSTDNGDTWSFSSYTNDGSNTKFTENSGAADTVVTDFDNNLFRYVNKIAVNPTNGDIYVASTAFGIFKSTDDGATFNKIDPTSFSSCPRYNDVVVTDNGDVIIALSNASDFCGVGAGSVTVHGIYRSTDDGSNWSDITPTGFPSTHYRTVLALAPSDNDTLYSMTATSTTTGYEVFQYDLNGGGSVSDRELTSYVPNYGGNVGELTQGSYNMVLAVKQDDPNFIVFGATNLYRFDDVNGLSSAPAQNDAWIGGYSGANDISQYANHHPDQQAFFFHPVQTSTAWSGHDGGLSKTTDITTTGSQDPVTWTQNNLHYNVNQYYHINISSTSGDKRYMGGNQDNGTPFILDGTQYASDFTDASSGDGAYCFFGATRGFTSAQLGQILRLEYKGTSNYLDADESFNDGDYTVVRPNTTTSDRLFIHPYVVDPNDEDYLYYPILNTLWRNNAVLSIPDLTNANATGWSEMTGVGTEVSSSLRISALEVSTSAANVLYFGASQYAGSSATLTPKVYKLTSANTTAVSTTPTDITPSTTNWPNGGWIHDIAINPADEDEVIVVVSNYNVVGLFYTDDGGASWSEIEGDLIGTANLPGPSIRSAAIHTYSASTCYLVGTSTGLYTTSTLNGSSTVWTKESSTGIGNTVVQSIASRDADGLVMIGTHGRGAFRGVPSSTVSMPTITALTDQCEEIGNTITITGTNLECVSEIKFNGTLAPVFTVNSATSITVTVPTGATTGTVTVKTVGGTATSADDFIVVGTTFSSGTWSNSAPTATVNAKISSAYDTDTYGDITCLNLCLEATLTINATGTVDINEDLVGGANLSADEGATVLASGTVTQNLSGDFSNLTINNSAGAALDASSSVSGTLTLTDGDLASDGNLTLKSTASGTAIVVNTNGVVTGNTTVERYTDAGTTNGYRYFTSPVTGATVNEFSGDIGFAFSGVGATFSPSSGGDYTGTSPFPNIFYYDESLIQSGTVSSGGLTGVTKDSAEFGWESPSATSDVMAVGQGFALQLSQDGVVDIGNGVLNSGNVNVSITNGGQTNSGWNLIGNPYPSPLDWNLVYDDGDNTDIDATVYLFDATSAFAGVYRGYNAASDVAVNGGSKNIAAMQGFFVNSTATSNTLNLKNTHRLTANSGVDFYRTEEDTPEKEGLLRLSLADEEGHADELVLYFIDGATHTWDKYDAHKFFDLNSDYPILMSYQQESGKQLMMDCRAPLGAELVTIPLQLIGAKTGVHQLNVAALVDFPTGAEIFLEDRATGSLQNLSEVSAYTFELSAGERMTNRFFVHFRVDGVTSLESELANRGVNIYSTGQEVRLEFADAASAIAQIRVLDISGKQLVSFHNTYVQSSFTIPKQGVFIIQVKNSQGVSAKRVYIGY